MSMPPFRRPDLWLPPLLLMAVIFALSSRQNLNSGLGTLDLIGRKVVHFSEYFLLCALWWRAFADGLGARRAALVAFLIASGYAATDEIHQAFVPTRHGWPVDWLIDSAGAATAALWLRARSRTGTAA